MKKVQIQITRLGQSPETLTGIILQETSSGAYIQGKGESCDFIQWFPFESKNIKMEKLN